MATSSAHPRRQRSTPRFPTPRSSCSAIPTGRLLTLVDVVVTVMNPGGAGPRRFNLPPSVGILELEPGIPPRGRLLPLLDFDAE